MVTFFFVHDQYRFDFSPDCRHSAMLRGAATRLALAARRSAVPVPSGRFSRHFSTTYSTTQEVPPSYHEKEVKMAPQHRQREEFVRYMATVLHPMVSEVTWDDQTNEITLFVYPQYIIPVSKMLRDHHQFQYKMLADITCVDTVTNVCHPLHRRIGGCLGSCSALQQLIRNGYL